MSKIQINRLSVQLICLCLTMVGVFTKFQITATILLTISVLAGAFYCGWVCPYGTFQDMFSKLGKILGIKKRRMPWVIQKYLRFSRYIIAAIIFAFTADILFKIMRYDPRASFIGVLSGSTISVGLLISVITFGVIAIFFDRPFCNYLCIEGAKHGAFSMLRVFSITRNEKSCVNCRKCDRVCKMNIKVSKADYLQSPQCINCFECISACPMKDRLAINE